MVEFQPFGPKMPHDPESTLEHQRDVREEAERAHDVKMPSETARRSSLGYAIVLLGAALFLASCFLPYYGYEFARVGTASLYDQLIVAFGGGLAVRPEAVPVRWGCHGRGRRPHRSSTTRAPIAWLPSRRGHRVVAHLDRVAAPVCQPPRGRDLHRVFIGDRLLAAGREHRSGGHRNHPGRDSPHGGSREGFGGPRRVTR